MGIPGFFTWLRQLTPLPFSKVTGYGFSDISLSVLDEKKVSLIYSLNRGHTGRHFDHVLIDCNHLVHRAAAAATKPEKVLKLLNVKLASDLRAAAIPRKTVFFAVDGPGPLAKMVAQRKRRVESHLKIVRWFILRC